MQATSPLTRQEAYARLSRLPAILSGREYHPAAEALRRHIGEVALDLVRNAFLTKALGGTDEAGISWEPSKAAEREGRATLIDTTALVQSLEAGAAHNILRTTLNMVIVGSDLPYAARQHAKRPFWREPLPDSWLRRIEDEMAEGAAKIAALLLQGG